MQDVRAIAARVGVVLSRFISGARKRRLTFHSVGTMPAK
jgi:hypothetical protein